MPVKNSTPSYPVTNSDPGVGQIMANFSFSNWATFLGFTAVRYPIGYMVGAPMRHPSGIAFTMVGALGGYMLATQDSWGRLTGYKKS